MPYDLHGVFVEACDCHVMCPCWFDRAPDDDHCTGLIAWHIDRGHIDRIDVSGLTLVSVSSHDGQRSSAHAHVKLYVDERAGESQRRVLVAAFSGRKGGPLGELAGLTGEIISVEPVHITFSNRAGETAVTAGDDVSVSMTPLVGATERVTTVADSALAELLGTPAEVGVSGRFRLHVSDGDLDIDVTERSANRGRFAYVMTGWADQR